MRASTALAALPLLAALTAAAAPSAATAQEPPPPPPSATPPPPPAVPPPPPAAYAYRPRRSPWYVGFGIGYGNGSYEFQGNRVNYRDHGAGSPFQLALQVEAGVTLTPKLLLGGEISGLVSSSSSQGIDYTLTVGQLLAVLTWFPMEQGLFLRGGLGFAEISSEQGDWYGYGYGYPTYARSSSPGFAMLGGLGYAWWLGRNFNLTLHGDVNLHTYTGNRDAPSNSATFTGYLGFRWY